MSNQGLRQKSARTIYGGSADVPYNEDFMRMFTAEGVPVAGTFNDRFLQWLNIRLSRTYTNLPEAQTAFAVSLGVMNWDSVGTFAAFATPPVNTVAPVISGTPQVGQTLTSTTGTWTGTAPITYAYQWKSGASNVGTNANTYVLVTGDIGANITCVVTATNPGGSTSATSNSLGPVAAPASTLNPSDKAAGVTLSNGNLTAAGANSVRSTSSKTIGKWHFEVTINGVTGDYPAYGVANASASINTYVGAASTSVGYFSPSVAGDVYQNNAVIASIGQYTSGILSCEIDADSRQIWFQHTSGARQGPYSVTATGALFVMISGNSGSQATVNFGATAFAITPTSGFTAWG